MPLNPQQQEVAEHFEGRALVIAGPGSGKTSTITARVGQLLLRQVPPERILCITFTNKAAQEMRERIAKKYTVGKRIKKPLLANMLEEGTTPWLPPAQLEALGFKIAAYPLTLLSAATVAMESVLGDLKAGRKPQAIKSFKDLRAIVGFDDYDAEAARYVRRES